MRPAELSDDHTGTIEVIAHATQWLAEQGCRRSVCCIYATAALHCRPTTWPEVFDSGERKLGVRYSRLPSIASSIFRAFRLHGEGGVEMFFPERYQTRSQDLPAALHDAAQFYWGRADSWTGGKPVFDPHSAAVGIPRWRVQDIDTEDDWRRAELIYELSKQRTPQ